MGPWIAQFGISVGSTIAAAMLLAIANGVRRLSRSVQQSTEATAALVKSVTELQASDRENRERLAVLWDREHWPLTSQYPSNRRNGTP
jgi:hypothetical protein